nr:hypothetical protein [Tanacetum cinerariifolium]
MYAQQAEQELLQTMREFHSCKQEEGQSISSYVLKMKSYTENLERLRHPMTLGIGKGNKKYKPQPQLDARGQNQNKGKNKLDYAPKPKIPPPPKRKDPTKDPVCHQCGDTGHWKRSCPRKLKPGALSLYVGNGQCTAVEAIGSYHLSLRSGLVIVLNNCHYAPSITRGIVSVSRLYNDGYVNQFVDNSIQVSRNNMVYFSTVSRDGIFEIDLSDSYTNVSSIYALSNKRAKSNLDSALLWHCRFGHISKKRIEKLQHDGLLNSTYLRAFEKCVPCMSRKMARKPYTHQVKRAKYLLGLIHTDVCGPFKIVSRQRASYFVTFTDDFNRYGYVYVLKHKHEVFETFKVFQKEVENQLGKTIKLLRSNHGGEYTSQDFLDHLEDHRIIAHRTPPYTPQHNGVSRRRNRTLLDMVENTPYKVWHGQAPKLSYLKVWGFEALVKQDTLTKSDKLEASLITQEASGSLEDLEIIQEEDTHPSIDTSLNHEEDDLEIDKPQSDIIPIRRSDIIHIRRSTKIRHTPDRMCLYIDAEEHELGDLGEPANYKAALLDPESDKWLNAMNVEIQSMEDNKVWDLVEHPPNGKNVGSKWLFKKKTDMDGAVHTYKARLVAKGYTQTSGIDYDETFSPVANIRAIRILITIASYYDYESKAAYILRIKIYKDRSRRLIGLCQSAYIEKFLKRYHMENSKRRSIPMQDKLRLSKSQGASTPAELKCMQNVPYALVVGSIMNTQDMFLVYGECQAKKFCYFTAEAEYIAIVDASKEVVWVRKFIFGLGVVLTIEEPISMYCDNTRAITIANESGITKGARHFCAKVHYLGKVIEYGDVKLEKVHTDDNLVDPFTKALAFPKHSEHTKNIGMLPASSLM